MPRGANAKRERQYEHVRDSARKRGYGERRAKEMAARTVNKERARSGESRTASRTSVQDRMSASERGGRRSHGGPRGQTREQLYAEARRRHVRGRSSMNKAELEHALYR